MHQDILKGMLKAKNEAVRNEGNILKTSKSPIGKPTGTLHLKYRKHTCGALV